MKTKHSIKISLAIIGIFWAGAAFLAVFAPYFFKNIYPEMYDRPSFVPVFLTVCIYIAMPVGAATLVSLTAILKNIEKDIVFERKNVAYMSNISICCFLAAAESMVVGAIHYSVFIFGLIAFLGGIIIRVIMNVFEKAIELKEENDMTI